MQFETTTGHAAGAIPNCAICFIGELRLVNHSAKLLQAHLFDILSVAGGVDVFVAAPIRGPFRPEDLFLAEQEFHGHRKPVLRDMHYEPEISNEELLHLVRKSATPAALKRYSSELDTIGSNWLSPIFGSPLGNGFRMYRHESHCKDMIIKAEKLRSFRYKWVVRTRPDLFWLAPHPPLSLLVDLSNAVWVFDTEHYAGLNIRHAIGQRNVMLDAVLSRWELLVAGAAVVANMRTDIVITEEVFAHAILKSKGVAIANFSTIAFQASCPNWTLNCFRDRLTDILGIGKIAYYPDEFLNAFIRGASLVVGSCWHKKSSRELSIDDPCYNESMLTGVVEELNAEYSSHSFEQSSQLKINSCAVCFLGELRKLNETASLLRRNLLKPLSARHTQVDVFISAPVRGPFSPRDFGLLWRESQSEAELDKAGPIVRDVRFLPEPSVEELRTMLHTAPQFAVERYKKEMNSYFGNWIGPVYGNAHGNSLRMYRHERGCKEMIEKHETKCGMRYYWVARSRPDLVWMVPHPPLSLFDTPGVLWTPDTEDWGGVNIRHAIGHRDVVMNTLFSRLDLLLAGDPIATSMPVGVNDETFTRHILRGKSVEVGRYDTCAYLAACPKWSLSCWRGQLDEHLHTKESTSVYAPEVLYTFKFTALYKLNFCWQKLNGTRVSLQAPPKNGCPDA